MTRLLMIMALALGIGLATSAPSYAQASLETAKQSGLIGERPDGRVDPYVSAGAAWVLFDEVEGGIDEVDIDSIDFDDDFGFVVNGGVSIDITEMFAINLDAKYVPVSSSATAVVGGVGSEPFDIDVNPLILSAGLSIQF